MFRQGPDFHFERLFEISEVEIARVNCSKYQTPTISVGNPRERLGTRSLLLFLDPHKVGIFF